MEGRPVADLRSVIDDWLAVDGRSVIDSRSAVDERSVVVGRSVARGIAEVESMVAVIDASDEVEIPERVSELEVASGRSVG